MSINADVQQLEPGALVELLEADMTPFGGEVLYFHAYPQGGVVVFGGVEYNAWPMKAEGFERTGSQPPRPKLTLGNVDGSISALCLMFDDCVGTVVTRRRTFRKYLDAVNFPEGNPEADPAEQFQPEIWYVDRKTNETTEVVEFELCSALEFNGAVIPARQIIANVCPWLAIGGYRGPYCTYSGPPVAMADDTPTSDPALDRCGGRTSSCKLRFGDTNPLPTGAFPSAGLVRV